MSHRSQVAAGLKAPGSCAGWPLAAALAAAMLLLTSGFHAAHGQMLRLDAIPSALGTRDAPLQYATAPAAQGPLWDKWLTLEAEIDADAGAIALCRAEPESCSPAAAQFIAIVDAARGLDGRRRLAAVNRAVNLAIGYASDLAQYGVSDYWASPLATFAHGRGDCEDYASAKLLALREAGVPADDLRLVLAHNRSLGDVHAVLAVRDGAHWLLLDNRSMVLVEDREVTDLAPLYVLDGDGVRQIVQVPVTAAAPASAPRSGVPPQRR